MKRGKVKWFNNAKGFGFIEHADGSDVFVHYSVIESQGYKTLKDGEEVEYEIEKGPKGLQANKVLRPTKVEDENGSEVRNTDSAESSKEPGDLSLQDNSLQEDVISHGANAVTDNSSGSDSQH